MIPNDQLARIKEFCHRAIPFSSREDPEKVFIQIDAKEYISICNPLTVLSMIEEIEKLRDELDTLNGLRQWMLANKLSPVIKKSRKELQEMYPLPEEEEKG